MIVVRRIFAVLMGLFLLVSFGGYLFVDRIASAALDPQFLKDELVRVDAYEFAYETLLPLAVDELLSEQNDWLPENFGAVELPANAEVKRVLDELLRDVFPPAFIQDRVEHVLDQLIPYLTGETDSFEIRFALGERVEYALAGDPSPLQRAFDELQIGRMLIEGAIASYEQQLVAQAEAAGVDVDEAQAKLDALGIDTEAATEWLSENLFTVIDDLRPFLTGEADAFDAQVLFDEQPALTELLANLLGTTAEELQARGFTFSSADLNEAIAGMGDGDQPADGSSRRPASGVPAAGPDPASAFESQLDFLRRDFVWTSEDFVASIIEDGTVSRGDIEAVRVNIGRVGTIARWGSLAAVISLALSIGFMGGRRWAGRLLWAAGSLLIVSAFWFATTGPVYAQLLQPRIHDALVDATESWPDSIDAASESFVQKVETISDSAVGGLSARSLQVLVGSFALSAAAAGWMYSTRRDGDGEWVAPASASDGGTAD